MTKVIQETPDKKFVIIDGICYSREAIESWTSDELAKLRNKLILKNQEASKDYEDYVYNAFQPYIMEAMYKEIRRDEKRALAKMIREMPREDVMAVFATYFNEFFKKKGDNSKNE